MLHLSAIGSHSDLTMIAMIGLLPKVFVSTLRKRPVEPTECLGIHLIPLRQDYCDAAGIEYPAIDFTSTSRTELRHMCGNGMSLNCAPLSARHTLFVLFGLVEQLHQ